MTALRASLLALAFFGVGCASLSRPAPDPLPDGWTRETFRMARINCSTRECRTRIAGTDGVLVVRTQSRVHGMHEIPGWERPLAERATFSMLAWGVRQVGGYTGHMEVGLGTREVSGDGDLEGHCSLFWIDEVERAHDRRDGDIETRRVRHARGTQCRVVRAVNPDHVLWRFDVGVAPPRDSLAAIYDALVAEQSPLLDRLAPLLLERVASPDADEERWAAHRDHTTIHALYGPMTRLVIERGETRMAVLHVGASSILDLAPEVTLEERGMLRLLAALLTAAPETTSH